MRVLCLDDAKKDIFVVFEIYEFCYSERLSGLVLFATDDVVCCVTGISVGLYRSLCKQLLVNGYIDLTMYGEVQDYDLENECIMVD